MILENALILTCVLAGIFAPALLIAFAIDRPCGGRPHNWERHPKYWRSRVCSRCARCETLGRGWEFDGYDHEAGATIAKSKGE